MQLFVERASGAQPSFRLVPENTEAVAEVCRRLDGVPLAIELAAARVRLLSPASLLQRLATRLELLTAGAADLPERQRTLRATIDWSYQLLSPAEQALFARLAVFVDGWTIDTAEHVCSDPGEDVLGTMTSLLEKSLLVLADSADGGDPRLRMLETVREFAEEKLVSGAQYSQLRDRHAEYFLRLVEQRQGDLRTSSHEAWSARLDAEVGNLRLAVQWWTDHHDYRALARFAFATLLHYWLSGRLRELTELLRVIPDSIEGLPDAERARLRIVQGFVAMEQTSLDRAAELAIEATNLLEATDDEATHSLALLLNGQILALRGDTGNASTLLERGHRKAQELGDTWMDAMGSWTRGFLDITEGNLVSAHDRFRRAVQLGRQISHWQVVGIVESTHGFLYFLEGDLQNAWSLNAQAVGSLRRLHYREGLAHCLQALAMVEAASGELTAATEALAVTDAVRTLIGVPFSGPYKVAYESLREQLEQELGDQFAPAWAAGRATDLYAALDNALRTGPPPQPLS